MSTILVTGGAGFIGSHLSENLLKDNNYSRVVVVDNLDPTYDPKYKKENLSILNKSKKFKFYKTDIRDKKALEKIFKKEKPEYIVHLAAKTDTRTSVLEPDEHVTVNVGGLLNLLELARVHKIKKFISFSSSSVYGNNTKPPFSETDIADAPLSPYAATKKSAELLAYTYYFNHGMDIACFRIFNAYGPRLRPSLVLYKWVDNIFNNKPIEMSGAGVRKRDFTYVGDIIDAVKLALKKTKGFEVFNIGNSSPVSLVELLAIIEKTTKKKAVVVSRESAKASVEQTYANVAKAKKILGWEPKTSMEKGVSNFVTWFKKNRFKNRV